MRAGLLLCLSGVVALYIATYFAYRQFGPTQYHWPRDSKHPVVLCRTESSSEVLMGYLFSLCLATEEAVYKLKYRNVRFTFDEWNAMDSSGREANDQDG